jgi:hypothetical protein
MHLWALSLDKIKFNNIVSGYEFFKTYCLLNKIDINYDYPEDKLIATSNIPGIRIIDTNGVEIKGLGTNIEGMDDDAFQVLIIGIPYPFFGLEFPHHVIAEKKLRYSYTQNKFE